MFLYWFPVFNSSSLKFIAQNEIKNVIEKKHGSDLGITLQTTKSGNDICDHIYL